MERDSAINILYNMRQKLEKKIMHQKVVSFFLLGIMIIQFILFYILKRFDLMGITGTLVSFIWCIWVIYTMITLKKEQDNIDEFYLINLSEDKK